MYKQTKNLVRRFRSWMSYNPPGALTSKGWRLFDQEFEKLAPIRYWSKNVFRLSVIEPIKWKYEKISDWIRYRTYDSYHVVDTGLEPQYYGLDTRILHVNFNMLKDFVEVDQALHTYWWSAEFTEQATWCEKHMPFYRNFFPFRRPDLGIKHLDWAITLDDPTLPLHEQCPSQAESARETKLLYKWWTEDRPARKEIDHVPYDDQGLGILSALDEDFDHDAEDYKQHVESMDARSKQEADWHEEDDQMLIRLIKLRRSLWT